MIEWLTETANVDRYLYIIIFAWMLWCQMSWFSSRRRIKQLKEVELLLRRVLNQYESGWLEEE